MIHSKGSVITSYFTAMSTGVRFGAAYAVGKERGKEEKRNRERGKVRRWKLSRKWRGGKGEEKCSEWEGSEHICLQSKRSAGVMTTG